MKIAHHISDDLLLAYGAGTLDEALSLLVATHLALCPACRTDLELAEAIGGAMMESGPADAAVDEAILETVMGGHQAEDTGRTGRSRSSGPRVLPQPLRDYAGGDAAEIRWKPVGGGIRQVPLIVGGSGMTARLLSIPAGKCVPDHGHRGFEATLVLSGSFYDQGSWYRRGDVGIADSSTVHQPAAGPEEDCICLALSDARLKFRSALPRLLQPFHGI